MIEEKKLKLGIPKGSLEEKTIELFGKAGYKIIRSSRSYFPKIDDPEIDVMLVRPQEIPRYVCDGILDTGICGKDWVIENKVDVFEVCGLSYSKDTNLPARWVLAVPEDSPIKEPKGLNNKTIATELVQVTKDYLKNKGISANVEFSWGATEAKPPLLCDAIVELVETGTTLFAHKLKIIDTVLVSMTVLIANKDAMNNEWKKGEIEKIAILLKGALESYKKVGLKMNLRKENLDKIIKIVPALRKPTISYLTDEDWLALETVVDEEIVRKIIPELKRNGVEGIVEYPLNKIVY
ncbi:TPA: ATP phosphoribosyltransferase [bacterium]|nr:ATP phosphoribosyltransferase [bacterium]